MAQSDQAMAMLAGRSPSEDENAYVAAVASRKNLGNTVNHRPQQRHTRKNDVQSKEDKDVSPDAGVLDSGVVAESLESCKDDEDSGPAVVERERQVDEELVRSALGLVELLHDIVDVLRTQYEQLMHLRRRLTA